jgi:hypothetical protein
MKAPALIIFLMVCHAALAQRLSDTLAKGNTFLRFNIVNLIDVSEPNISFGAERCISDYVSLALDAGYILMSQRFRERGNSSGFIIRPAVRYFPEKSKIFFEAELHFKQHTHHLRDWIGRDAVAGVPAYEEFREFRLRKQVIGPHLKFGSLIPVTKRLWFEFYIGVGLHYRKYTVLEEQNLMYSFEQHFEIVNSGSTEKLAAIPIGWRILYKVR